MLSPDELLVLEKLGSVFFSVKKCALIIGVKESSLRELVDNENTQEYLHYTRVSLQSEFKLREQIVELALRGSTNAQADALAMIRKMKSDE